MFRLLSAKLDIKDFEKAKDLDEVIRMTKTFIEREIENSEKKGKLELLTSMIKEGILTLKQAADKMNMTVPQFKTAVKKLALE